MVRESVSSGLDASSESLTPSLLLEQSASSTLSRIDGYDAARGVAILGMIVVNYFSIFRSSTRGVLPFESAADFLSGRAATLFVMLAGIGLTLMSRKLMLAGNAESWMKFRGQVVRRSVILFFMGILLSLVWPSDILHFYCLFLIAGSFFLQLPPRRIVMIIALIWAISGGIFVSSIGDPNINTLGFLPDYFFLILDELFIGGQYAFFPWFGFLLTGIWFGLAVMKNQKRQIYILIAATLVFLVSQAGMMVPDWFTLELNDETALWALFDNSPFPSSPFFALSAGGTALMVLCAFMLISRQARMPWLIDSLKNMGRMSLTIYIGHILVGKGMAVVFKQNCTPAHYPLAVTLFMVVFVIGLYFLCDFWLKCFKYGPLEWLMRKGSVHLLPGRF